MPEHPARLNRGARADVERGLVADHGGDAAQFAAQKGEDLIDGIGDGGGAAAGIEQADGPRLEGDIFDQERTGIAGVEEPASFIGNHDLIDENLGESGAAGTFIFIGHLNGGVQAGDAAGGQAGGATAFLDRLAQSGTDGIGRERADAQNRTAGADHPGIGLRHPDIDIGPGQRAEFDQCAHRLSAGGAALDVD